MDHNKANLALQEVTLRRQEALFKDQWVSDQALDQVRARADIAKADVGVAEANRDLAANQVDIAAATVEKTKALLAYTQIVAPFDGVVARRLVNRGDLVQAATATRTTPSAGSLFTVAADRHDPGVLRRSGGRRPSPSRRRSGHRQAFWLRR